MPGELQFDVAAPVGGNLEHDDPVAPGWRRVNQPQSSERNSKPKYVLKHVLK